ncbi:hypothetical protein B0I37DRAFT_445645 [Chaetomium sp. MPI-CAGE-AT-0009]|nr:hypothetical protein B0I37DRAFT_445645 [Chaetomium sp. MPI-CAGE-AT-0009]
MDPSSDATIATNRRMRIAKDARVESRASLASLSAPYQHGSDWARVREDTIAFPPARSKRGSKGPRSLVATCLRVLADNIGAATGSAISHLPDHLQRALWEELYPRNMSLHAWQAISAALLSNPSGPVPFNRDFSGKHEENRVTVPMAVLRYCQEILNPPCPLSIYTAPFMDWKEGLVYLCIDNVARFQTHELIALATLRQLAVLELIERGVDESPIDDRLIRGWSEVAGARFPTLRVLRIASRMHMVRERGMQYLLSLPSLEIIDMTESLDVMGIVKRCGWKRTVPPRGGSLFVSYAEAYLDGQMAVHPAGVEGLRTVFEDDKQQVVWVDNPRLLPTYREGEKRQETKAGERNAEGRAGHVEPEPEQPDLRNYLDDGWRAVLQGTHHLSKTAAGQAIAGVDRKEMSDDQVFWFLAFLNQHQDDEMKQTVDQKQAAGVTLPGGQFVSLRLRDPHSSTYHDSTMYGYQRGLDHDRLIFSRRREAAVTRSGPSTARHLQKGETEQPPDPPPSWAPRSDDRREKNLKPRKRQKRSAGDLLSSLGVPQGKSG